MDRLQLNSILLSLPRSAKRAIVFLIDSSLCVLALWLSLYLRLGEFVYLDEQYLFALLTSLTIALPIFILNGLYRAIFRYSGWPALMTVAKCVAIYGIIYAAIFTAIGVVGTPRTIGIIQPILLFILIGSSRAIALYWLGGEYKKRIGVSARERVLIYGAGSAGRQIAAALSGNREVKVLGFLDDEPSLIGQVLNGLTIYDPDQIKTQAERLGVTDILLAIPSSSQRRRQEIIEKIRLAKLSVRTLPSVSEIAQGKISVNDIKPLDINDLLGRTPVEINYELIGKNISQKCVMVTGAGGSIGSELCRQILRLHPTRLVLVEHSEFALYTITEELISIARRYDLLDTQIIPLLVSVRDRTAMERIMEENTPDTLYHAAAYKHVPLVERNVREAILNNVFGTQIVVELAVQFMVKNFILISTDKAVRPTNVMGATKRWAELIVQNSSSQLQKESSDQHFSSVRFGNVLGSSGSVVPLFRKQISNGGPVTLTHYEVTRYFMSIKEAVGLVLLASTLAHGQDIFLLDMGEPVKIMELARKMIELSGLSVRDSANPDGDIEILEIGLRPGEKLFEELLIDLTSSAPTAEPKIRRAVEPSISDIELFNKLRQLKQLLDAGDSDGAADLLMELAA